MPSQREKEWKDYSYVEYYDYLKRYSCFLSKNKWDGEDIAQETMLRVIQNYGDGHFHLEEGFSLSN